MSACLTAVLSSYMQAQSAHYQIPPAIVLSVIASESSCRIDAKSGKGDVGLMQIRRGVATHGYDGLTDAELMEPRLNIKLGVRRLARAKRICGGNPERWLSNYAGLQCGSSKYSRNVIFGRSRAGIPQGNVYQSEATGFDHSEKVNVSSDRFRQ